MTINGKEIPKNVVFDVVGSRGAIGEKARSTAVASVTAGLLSHPKTQDIPNVLEIAKMAYQDAGVKNPERIMNTQKPEVPQEVQQQMQQMQQQMQELQGQNQELEKKLAITKAVNEAKVVETVKRSKVNADSKEYTTMLEGELAKVKAAIEMAKARNDGSVSLGDINAMHDTLTRLLQEPEEEKKEPGVSEAVTALLDKVSQPIKLQVIRGQDGKVAGVVGGR